MSAVVLALLTLAPATPAVSAAADEVEDRFGEYLGSLGGAAGVTDVEISADGLLWIAETRGHRVRAVSRTGATVVEHGGRGAGPAQLFRPEGLGLAPDGEVLVADTGNRRVVRLGPRGELRGHFGAELLIDPVDVAADERHVYVADRAAHVVRVFDRSGAPVRTLGSRGRGPGELSFPAGLALGPPGVLFVADRGNHRVQRVDLASDELVAWGDRGPYPGLFGAPGGVAWHAERLYVAEAENHRVQIFDALGEHLYEWGRHALEPREGAGALHYPAAVAVAPDGSFAAVAEPWEDRVQLVGEALGEHTLYSASPTTRSGFPSHYGTAASTASDLLVLVEPETQVVLVFDISGYVPILIHRLGRFGDGRDQFLEIADVDLADDWTLVVSDRGARRVTTFLLDHHPDDPVRIDPALSRLALSVDLEALAEQRNEPRLADVQPGALARGRGPLCGDDAAFYVVDELSASVLVFGPRMELLGVLGAGELRRPAELLVDGGQLYVADRDLGSVEVFGPDGERTASWTELGTEPAGLALSRDRLLVSDAADHRVRATRDGSVLEEWGGPGLGAREFLRPRALAVDFQGRIFVADHGNHRVQILDTRGEFVSAFGARLYVQPTR